MHVSRFPADRYWLLIMVGGVGGDFSQTGSALMIYTVSQKNWANFIFTVTLANVGRFFKFFQCRNQKEMAHSKNKKFPTIA